MVYKINIKSNNYFSTINPTPNLVSNRKYAVDFSFLPDNKRYVMTYEFCSKNILNGLTYTLYNGFFNGTDSNPNLSWFNTATVLSSGITTNLTSLDTASNYTFGDVDNRSMKLSGLFKAQKTGIYRFFTRSDDASFIYINATRVVANGGPHAAQDRFGNYNMVAGTYYQFDIYYGERDYGQEFSAGFIDPDGSSTSTNLNDFTKNGYNLDTFFLNTTSFGQFNSVIDIKFDSILNQNYIASNNVRKRNTSFAGILNVKGLNAQYGYLYSHPKTNKEIVLHNRPSGNFIDVNIYNMDMTTLTQLNTDYVLTLYFDEIH